MISNFRAKKDETRMKYFLGSHFDTEATRYGVLMEKFARKKFEEVTGYVITEVGLVVRQGFDWLGGSPDGIFLNEHGQLCAYESKCPFKCKDKNIQMDYLEHVRVQNENGDRTMKTVLKKNHPYYAQVQLQMYVTHAKLCHFFVWSSVDHKHIVIEFDETYC